MYDMQIQDKIEWYAPSDPSPSSSSSSSSGIPPSSLTGRILSVMQQDQQDRGGIQYHIVFFVAASTPCPITSHPSFHSSITQQQYLYSHDFFRSLSSLRAMVHVITFGSAQELSLSGDIPIKSHQFSHHQTDLSSSSLHSGTPYSLFCMVSSVTMCGWGGRWWVIFRIATTQRV